MVVYVSGMLGTLVLVYIATHIKGVRELDENTKFITSKCFAFLSFLPFAAIMAFRYDVGTDFPAYVRMFFHESSSVEYGYSLLNRLVRSISSVPQSIFIVSAVIICGGFFWAIYRESVNPMYSVLLFFLCKDYFMAMNGMRQYIATAIALLTIPMIRKRQWLRAGIVIAIAFTFHRSVIIFVVLYILSNVEIPPIVGGSVVAGTYILSRSIMRFILPILQRYNFYTDYFLAQSLYRNADEIFVNRRAFIIFLCFFILLSWEYRRIKKNGSLKLLYSAVLCSLLILSLSEVMPTNFSRLTWHLDSILILYVPLALKAIPDKKLRIGIGAAILISYMCVSIPELLAGQHGVLPYQTVWNYE